VIGAELPPNYGPAYSGIVLHPFFEPGGERAPITHPLASAAAFGLGAETTQEQLGWAAREAIAFLTRMSHFELGGEARETVSVGGGVARDPVFLQLLANVLDGPVQPHGGGDTALRGLAAVAMGAIEAQATDEKPDDRYLSPPGEEVRPEGGAVRSYLERKYRLFKQLIDDVSGHWEELAALKGDAERLA
jgi:sugar (pentulose or hexulose) kinase